MRRTSRTRRAQPASSWPSQRAIAHGAIAAQFGPGPRWQSLVDLTGTLTESSGEQGRALYLGGSGTAEVVTLPKAPGTEFTVVALVDFATLGSYDSPVDLDTTLAGGYVRSWQFRKTNANKIEVIRFNTSGTPYSCATTGAVVANKPVFMAMRSRGTAFTATLDRETVSGTVSSGTPQTFRDRMLVGASGAGGGGRATAAHNGRIYGWVVYDRYIEDEYLAELASNFWAQAANASIWIPVSAGGGVTGTASITLGALTSSATGTVAVQGTSSITLSDLTLIATGTSGNSVINGSASITLDDVTSSAAGTVAISGTSSVTLEDLVSSGTGTVLVSGTSSITLGDLTAFSEGLVTDSTNNGSASITLGALTLVATGGDGNRTRGGGISVHKKKRKRIFKSPEVPQWLKTLIHDLENDKKVPNTVVSKAVEEITSLQSDPRLEKLQSDLASLLIQLKQLPDEPKQVKEEPKAPKEPVLDVTNQLSQKVVDLENEVKSLNKRLDKALKAINDLEDLLIVLNS